MRNRPIYDVVALLARCGVGMVFVAHGWQKIQVGVTVTGRNLDAMGAPAPTASAVYSTFVELLGGTALILGLALPAAGTLLFLDMAGSSIFIHAKHGIFLVDNGKVHNGFELALVLGMAALVFAAGGGGRLSLDHRLFGRGRAEQNGHEQGDPPRRALERGGPAPDETRPLGPATQDDAAYGDKAPRRRAKLGLFRRRTESSPPAERSGERPIPPAGRFPDPPDTDETSSTRPRLASEMITDTSRDVIVAGAKKPEPPSDDTTPVRARRKPPKSVF
jgi:putative oxidoreductase